MRHLYIATNETESFDALVMAKNIEDALHLIKEYANDSNLEGEWSLKPTVPSFVKEKTFSCDYLIQDPKQEKAGVIYIDEVEDYYMNIYQLSHAVKINLNNDMTLLITQSSDGTIMSKVVMGQGEEIEYNNAVSEQTVDESELTDFLIGNSDSSGSLIDFATQEAIYQFQKANVKYTKDDVNLFANQLLNDSEDWIDGHKLHMLCDKFIRKNDLEPADVTFTKSEEIVDYIREQYKIYGCVSELSSLYFKNVFVENLSKRNILNAYCDIQKECNGDDVFELSNYSRLDKEITGYIKEFASDSKYDELYTGNLEEFLTSFPTETEENTCFCRLLEYEENEEGLITGELLDFVF